MKILALSCANFVKFLPCPACKFTPSIIATFSTQLRGWVVGSKSTKMYNFACPWVRIPVRTENMSVIFFCADFFSFSYLKSASDSFRGVHKQYGPGRERGRQFYPIYLVTWFIVECSLIGISYCPKFVAIELYLCKTFNINGYENPQRIKKKSQSKILNTMFWLQWNILLLYKNKQP